MKKKSGVVNRKILVFFSCLGLVIGCKKNIYLANENNLQNPSNFYEVFQSFYVGLKKNYLYWDVDTTQWDLAFANYKPRFESLDINNPVHVKKAVGYFRDITKGIIDGHFRITFQHPAIADSQINPLLERKKLTSEFHQPYSYFQSVKNYLDVGNLSASSFVNGAGPIFVATGSIRDSILYFSCSNFYLSRIQAASENSPVKDIVTLFKDNLRFNLHRYKGLILDFRSNSGGDLSDMNFLIGELINDNLFYGYTKYKGGPEYLNFTPWFKAVTNSNRLTRLGRFPVVVLGDSFSASLTELIIEAIVRIPNGTFIGETTFGATGVVTLSEVYNKGQFQIANFMNVKMSSAAFKSVDSKIYEGKGILPTIEVPFNKNELDIGIDRMLENAILVLQ